MSCFLMFLQRWRASQLSTCLTPDIFLIANTSCVNVVTVHCVAVLFGASLSLFIGSRTVSDDFCAEQPGWTCISLGRFGESVSWGWIINLVLRSDCPFTREHFCVCTVVKCVSVVSRKANLCNLLFTKL